MNNIVDYLGIPYIRGGRDTNTGLDCWGLVIYFYWKEFGLNLPSHSHIDPSKQSIDEYSSLLTQTDTFRNFDLVEFSKEDKNFNNVVYGDIIIFNVGGNPFHTAIALDNKNMLHSHEKAASVIERFTESIWIRRLRSFHRYKA